jgi:hypothetical protein
MTGSYCPMCKGKIATARTLVRRDAERIMQLMAQEMRRLRPDLSIADSEEVAKQSILIRRPSVIVQCDNANCRHEWVE